MHAFQTVIKLSYIRLQYFESMLMEKSLELNKAKDAVLYLSNLKLNRLNKVVF